VAIRPYPLKAGGGNLILGNIIGTDRSSDPGLGNAGDGVTIDNSPYNLIGLAPNLISGNLGDGVKISGALATGNIVFGNFIGTNSSVTQAVPNLNGVEITDAPANSVTSNVISGNNNDGVLISGPGASGNAVEANYFGLDGSGQNGLPNFGNGVAVAGAPGTTIGGTTPGARNIISGNLGDGV
jgi:hypothetical protein